MSNNVSGVYAIVHDSGKLYVGSAVDVWNRNRQHTGYLRAGKHHSRHLQNAWNKYGENQFHFAVIEECRPAHLIRREQYWMDELRPEYNIASFAGAPMTGHAHSPETRANISAAMMGNKNSLGHKHTPEARAKISAARKAQAGGRH